METVIAIVVVLTLVLWGIVCSLRNERINTLEKRVNESLIHPHMTFSDPMPPLTSEQLRKAVDELHAIASVPTPLPAVMNHNLSKEQLARLFPDAHKNLEEPEVLYFYGIPIHQRWYVPEGEFWFADKDGNIIRRFHV